MRPNAGPLPWWIFRRAAAFPDAGWRDYLALAAPSCARRGQADRGGDALRRAALRAALAAFSSRRPEHRAEGRLRPSRRRRRARDAGQGRARLPASRRRAWALRRLYRSGAALSQPQRRENSARSQAKKARIRGRPRERARFRRGRDAAWAGGLRHSRGPAAGRARSCPGLAGSGELSRHRQRPFQDRAAARTVPPCSGSINGTVEWLFSFPDRSRSRSAAPTVCSTPAARSWRRRLWAEVAGASHLEKPLPPWQIIKEKRATFAATPEENARRPGARDGFCQSDAGRRLDGDGPAGDDRRRGPVRRSRGRSASATKGRSP